LAAAAKTLAAAEVARMLRRVGDEEFLDMDSLLGAVSRLEPPESIASIRL
jgi:hypothetical protein